MIVKEILEKCNDYQKIEIANKENYFFGTVAEVPIELFYYKVDYIASGVSDSTSEANTLLIDAHK